MDIISTVKPDIPKKPEVKIEYNNRSYESYMKNGFADNIPRSIKGPRDRMQTFLNKVDLRKGPIERTVKMIVRLRAPDWNSSKKNERKEFIYYFEDWTGNDWLGIPIDPFSEHIEGKYTEVLCGLNWTKEQASMSTTFLQELENHTISPFPRKMWTR